MLTTKMKSLYRSRVLQGLVPFLLPTQCKSCILGQHCMGSCSVSWPPQLGPPTLGCGTGPLVWYWRWLDGLSCGITWWSGHNAIHWWYRCEWAGTGRESCGGCWSLGSTPYGMDQVWCKPSAASSAWHRPQGLQGPQSSLVNAIFWLTTLQIPTASLGFSFSFIIEKGNDVDLPAISSFNTMLHSVHSINSAYMALLFFFHSCNESWLFFWFWKSGIALLNLEL